MSNAPSNAVKELQVANNRLSDALAKAEFRGDEQGRELRAARKQLAKTLSDLSLARRQVEALTLDKHSWQRQLETAKEAARRLEFRLSNAVESHEAVDANLRAQSDMVTMKSDLEEALHEIEATKTENSKLRRDVAVLTRALALHSEDAGADIDSMISTGKAFVENDSLKVQVIELENENKRLVAMNSELEQSANRTAELSDALQSMEKQCQSLEVVREEASELARMNDELRDKVRALDESLKYTQTRLSEAESDQHKLRRELRTANESYHTELVAAHEGLIEIQKRAASIEAERDGLLASQARDKNLLVEHSSRLAELDAKVSLLEDEKMILQREVETLESSYDAEREAVESLQQSLSAMKDRTILITQQLEQSHLELAETKAAFKDCQVSLNEREALLTATISKSSSSASTIRELNNRLDSLHESYKLCVEGKDSLRQAFEAQVSSLEDRLRVKESEVQELDIRVSALNRELARTRSVMTMDTIDKLNRCLRKSPMSCRTMPSTPKSIYTSDSSRSSRENSPEKYRLSTGGGGSLLTRPRISISRSGSPRHDSVPRVTSLGSTQASNALAATRPSLTATRPSLAVPVQATTSAIRPRTVVGSISASIKRNSVKPKS